MLRRSVIADTDMLLYLAFVIFKWIYFRCAQDCDYMMYFEKIYADIFFFLLRNIAIDPISVNKCWVFVCLLDFVAYFVCFLSVLK